MSGTDMFVASQVGDPTKAANESALSPIMNFTQVAPFGNASDYPFYYGCTADLGQTAYSNATVYGLMVGHSSQAGCRITAYVNIQTMPCTHVQVCIPIDRL